jgi:OmpA-OmpF porin, OOP family
MLGTRSRPAVSVGRDILCVLGGFDVKGALSLYPLNFGVFVLAVFKRVVLATLLISSPLAQAEPEAAGITVSPGAGLTHFDDFRDLGHDTTYVFGLGYRYDNPWAIEFDYGRTNTNSDITSVDVDVTTFALDGLYHFNRSGVFIPYATFGIGHSNFDTAAGDTSDSALRFGFGAKYLFSNNAALRTEFKVNRGFDNQDLDAAFLVRYQYTFGEASTPAPKPAPVKMAPVDGDDDRDGVANSKDKCPGTPAGRTVDANGCELDADRDGVVDGADECPDTFPPAEVDGRGCYIMIDKVVQVTLDVKFDFDSAETRPEHTPEAMKVVEFMQRFPLTRVTLQGHTDSQGSDAYNQRLSEQRANSILRLLVDKLGIPANRVSSVGHGESQPVASNDTDEGRQRNRRVVAQIEALQQVKKTQ